MTPRSEQPTHWRAIVQGRQIGFGYQSREEAIEAAQTYCLGNDGTIEGLTS